MKKEIIFHVEEEDDVLADGAKQNGATPRFPYERKQLT